jgi:acetyl esterase/lipase
MIPGVWFKFITMKICKILFVAVLLLFCTVWTRAQESQIIPQEQIYKHVNGTGLKVYIFSTPGDKQDQQKPAIAFFHGGGWVFGKPQEFFGACERYARKGFITFSFQYRLSMQDDGTYPHPGITPVESVMDARSAIRWLRENASSLGIDPGRIVAGGQSAGGQLALSTALLDDINETSDNPEISPVPDALLLFSSSVNTMEAWIDWILGDKRDQIWAISPYHNLRKNMPPAIGFHGEDDCMVPIYVIRLFRERMEELGNVYELVIYPGQGHYLGEGNEKYSGLFDEEILERTDVFLDGLGYMKNEKKFEKKDKE